MKIQLYTIVQTDDPLQTVSIGETVEVAIENAIRQMSDLSFEEGFSVIAHQFENGDLTLEYQEGYLH